MPIEITQSDSGKTAIQSFDRPTVYMDHWAIRLFSDDYRLQDRFVRTLARKRGTLLLSNISIHEFQRPETDQHSATAERFLDRLMPDLYFTDLNFEALIAIERAQEDNGRQLSPPSDQKTLDFLARRIKSDGIPTVKGLLAGAHVHRDPALVTVKQMMDRFRQKVEETRNDPAYVKKARATRRTPARTRTLIIIGDLLRHFFLDPKATLTDNDLNDFLHASMSVNCCDYVLLDGAWYERVRALDANIRKDGLAMPIAKCFSRKHGGLEAFLADLANFGV